MPPTYVAVPALSADECAAVLAAARQADSMSGRGSGGILAYPLSLGWLDDRLEHVLLTANAHWRCDLRTVSAVHVLRYPLGAFHPRHVDTVPDEGEHRQLSLSFP